MKLDFIKLFPVLCFIFNFLAYMSCEYEINKVINILKIKSASWTRKYFKLKLSSICYKSIVLILTFCNFINIFYNGNIF